MNYHGGPGQGMVPPQFSNGATHYHQPQMFPPQGMPMEMHGGHGMMPPQQQPPPPHHMGGAQQHQGGGEVPQGPESDYKHQSSVLAEQSGVSTTAFDSVEELLWVGTNAVSLCVINNTTLYILSNYMNVILLVQDEHNIWPF